jgi:hypothetical protein
MPDRQLTWRSDDYCPVPEVNDACPVPLQSFSSFQRARIPDGYREAFETATGYSAINDGVAIGSTPLVDPVRVFAAPEAGWIYVVDAGGQGGARGLRGQVMRVNVTGSPILADEQFRVR